MSPSRSSPFSQTWPLLPTALATLLLTVSLSGCSLTGTLEECTRASSYDGPAVRSVPDSVWERRFSRPIDGPLDPELTHRLDAVVDELLDPYPALSVAMALPGEGTWTAVRGFALTQPETAVLPESRFQVGSITKPFTAAVVLELVDEGKLALDATADTWFPSVPKANLITVRHLLEHRSGLVSFNALPGGRDLGDGYRSPQELVTITAGYDLQFCPGSRWAYSNTGYVMLGQIVEAIEGQPFADVLDERILQPLGLNQTAMRTPSDDGSTVVSGHAGGIPVQMQTSYATPYAAGALVSTAPDLVRFWHAFLNGQVLPQATVQQAFRDLYPMQPFIPAPSGVESFYGQGVQFTDATAVGPGLMLEHSGGAPGFNAVVAYLVEDDAFVAIAVNDKDVPAVAGLWQMVQVLREYRADRQATP
jgi:D-alanyl-D-alanine carboxypeptidase